LVATTETVEYSRIRCGFTGDEAEAGGELLQEDGLLALEAASKQNDNGASNERLLELGLLVVCAGVGELGLLVLGWVEAWGALSLLLDDGLRGGGDVLAAEPWLPLSSLSGCSARCVLHDWQNTAC